MIITDLGEKFKEVLLDIEKIIKEDTLNNNLNYLTKGCSSRVYTYSNFTIKIFNKDKCSYMYRDDDCELLPHLAKLEVGDFSFLPYL